MTSRVADRGSMPAPVLAFSDEYDRSFSGLEFDGVLALWEQNIPTPIYIGDEYAEPAIGIDAVQRHFARLAARVGSAEMNSEVVEVSELGGDVLRCVRLTRWSITPREQTSALTGASWVTWILHGQGTTLRIVHHTETPVYDIDESHADVATTNDNEG